MCAAKRQNQFAMSFSHLFLLLKLLYAAGVYILPDILHDLYHRVYSVRQSEERRPQHCRH